MAYRIALLKKAARQLEGLPRRVQIKIGNRINSLAKNPRPQGVKKLTGGDDLYRLRVNEYRIIYQVRDKILLILVVGVGHRSDVYRLLPK